MAIEKQLSYVLEELLSPLQYRYKDFLLINEKGFFIFSTLSFNISRAAVSPMHP